MDGVQRFGKKWAFRRKIGLSRRSAVQSSNWKWLRILGFFANEIPRRKQCVGRSGGGRGTGVEPSPRRPEYSSELWRTWFLAKGAAKAAISEPKAPQPLVGDLHNPFSVKSLWRNAGHPQVTSALCHSALNIRPSPQNFVDPFRARFGLRHRSKQLKLFDHFVGAGEQKIRDCDLAGLARVKRVNFSKAICA
jgi:hypothetical protein